MFKKILNGKNEVRWGKGDLMLQDETEITFDRKPRGDTDQKFRAKRNHKQRKDNKSKEAKREIRIRQIEEIRR